MGYLNRETIFAVDDRQYEDVPVPEWGGTVRVMGLTGAERDRMEASVVGNGRKMNLTNFRARLCALSIVDENGDRVFSDLDVGTLGKKSAAALEHVFSVSQRLSGLSDSDVDDLVGESGPGLSESSTSA